MQHVHLMAHLRSDRYRIVKNGSLVASPSSASLSNRNASRVPLGSVCETPKRALKILNGLRRDGLARIGSASTSIATALIDAK
jgi:hypothetical protein